MKCRTIQLGLWLSLWGMALAVGGAVRVMAQQEGWCEEKYIVRASTMNDRVTMPSVAAEGDNVYVAYRQGNIKVIYSRDRGKTWSQPVDLGPELRVTSAPAIAVMGDKVVVVWPAQVEVETLNPFQLFLSESDNAGVSFSPPRQITQSREDTFSPKFLLYNGQAMLLWLETPLAETLGRIPSISRPDFRPESVEDLYNTRVTQGSLEDRMRRVRTTFYVRSYTFSTGSLSAPNKIDLIYAENIPHIFQLYGPLNGALYITVNQNTEIKSYESKDGGQTWIPYFQDRQYFDPRMMLDLKIVDGKRISTWIRRTTGRVAVNFRQGMELKSVQLAPEHNVRYVPRLAYSDGDCHVVWEAGSGDDSWVTYIRTDKIPPTSTVTAPASPSVTGRQVEFQWQGDDNISSPSRLVYAFTYDGKTWSAPQPETKTVLPAPPDGEYVFMVRAEDVAGNIQEKPAEFAFNTFQSAPETAITQSPSPAQPVNSRSVTIAFKGEDNSDKPEQLEYSAQADDGDWTPFARGTTHTFTNLSNGTHTLRIRMKDSRGNVDSTPAECTVTVKVGLELVLESTPPLSTNADVIQFGWSAKDDKGNPVQLNYFYQLDKEPVQELQTAQTLELNELEEGRHVIQIWGREASGDETQKEAFAWLVDRTPPETRATFNREYNGSFPVIQLEGTDSELPDGSRVTQPRMFEYQIKDGPWVSFEHAGAAFTFDRPLSFYEWGYILKIRAIDAAGNADPTPAEVDLRVFARTNPYLFYTVVVVAAVVLLYLFKLLVGRLLTSRPRRRSSVPEAASAFGIKEETATAEKKDLFSTTTSTSSFKFDDDDDDLDDLLKNK
ncbi:MAG: hypothetical protein HPY51_15390 [Candidatus Omnitrophica bacterium]|nr:hypothetical protein [Candidatus Omnitrophota bacterium]